MTYQQSGPCFLKKLEYSADALLLTASYVSILNTVDAMTKTSALSGIQTILDDEDFATYLMPISEDNLFERLFIGLGQDSQSRDLTLQIHFINDITNALGVDDDAADAYILQFFLLLPFTLNKTYMSEIARVVLTLNRILPIGAFGISEDDGMAYFQYNLICAEHKVDDKVLVEAVSIIGFFVSEFAPRIDQVSEGKISYEALIQELSHSGIDFPPLSTDQKK